MPYQFREMTVDDIPAFFALRPHTRENAISIEDLDTRYGVTPATLAAALRGASRGWLCEVDARIVGFCIGDGATAEVQVIAIAPAFEGRGIGRALLECVTEWLFSLGHAELWLMANPDPMVRASGFYARLGWVISGRKGGENLLRLAGRQAP